MSVLALLRCWTRTQRTCVSSYLVQQRMLTGAEAVNALRPLYFAVHPDFFGRHPREREVNENSLKRLNGYLETLQKPGGGSVQPLKLTFYIRDTKDSSDVQPDLLPSGFRTVSFTLKTRDVLSTVRNVLASCSLPVEHIKELRGSSETSRGPSEAGPPFYRPIRWDKSYYSFTGFRDPEMELQQAARVEPSLELWLRNNEAAATQKHLASLPRRAELSRVKQQLVHTLHLSGIRWQRTWGVAHRCGQLHSLSRLARQNPQDLVHLPGHTLVFADQSGMNASGHVLLGTMDVHHVWTELFRRLPGYRRLQQQTERLRETTGVLLGGATVVHVDRLGPLQPITEHYNLLACFHKVLVSRPLRLHPGSLRGLTVVLDSDRSRPQLHQMGFFIAPTTCDPAQLQVFLQSHASEARHRTQRRKQLQTEEGAVVDSCLQALSLQTLTKDRSISSVQMVACCHRLLELRPPLLQGLHLCVSHFYSILEDGVICVPWDWKG